MRKITTPAMPATQITEAQITIMRQDAAFDRFIALPHKKLMVLEEIAKPLETRASRRQSPEKCGHYVRNPAKPDGFAITSLEFRNPQP